LKGGKYGNSQGYGKGKAPVKKEKSPEERSSWKKILKRKEFLREKNF